MHPINASIEHGDVNAFTMYAAGLQSVSHFDLRRSAVERRSARVFHAIVEMHGDRFIFMNGLNHAHLFNRSDGCRRDRQCHSVEHVVVAKLDICYFAVHAVRRSNAGNREIDSGRAKLIQKLILLRDDLALVLDRIKILTVRFGDSFGDDHRITV
jgi:hypothetical protein